MWFPSVAPTGFSHSSRLACPRDESWRLISRACGVLWGEGVESHSLASEPIFPPVKRVAYLHNFRELR